jgi:hypothetical protein
MQFYSGATGLPGRFTEGFKFRPAGEDRIDAPTDKLRCHFGNARNIAAKQLQEIELEISALLKPELMQLLFEGTRTRQRARRYDYAEA